MKTSERIGYSKNTRLPSSAQPAIVVGILPSHSGVRPSIDGISPRSSCAASSAVTGAERGFHAGSTSQPRSTRP